MSRTPNEHSPSSLSLEGDNDSCILNVSHEPEKNRREILHTRRESRKAVTSSRVIGSSPGTVGCTGRIDTSLQDTDCH